LDRPDLAPSDVRCCPYWYRCEKPDTTDGAQDSETTRILILNLNYSIVRAEDCNKIGKQVTVIYDAERLKPILRNLGATKMTIYCPADLQDYPYAVVDFPDIAQSRVAFRQLQGRCLGYSGRHLRVQYAPLYDYTFGGRHVVSEDTRDIMIVSLELEPEQLRSTHIPERKRDESPSRSISPQKNRYSRMVVTKHGRRIQKPKNLVRGVFYWFCVQYVDDDFMRLHSIPSAERADVADAQQGTKIKMITRSSRPCSIIIIILFRRICCVRSAFSDRL